MARTVIIGGLLNSDMSEDALSCAKEIDGVCSIKYPLPTEEVEQLGKYMGIFPFQKWGIDFGFPPP